MILLEIRSKSIAFGTNLKRSENKKQQDIEKEIKILENDPGTNINEIEIKKQELQKIREQELEGKLIRSRAKWIDKGEKMTQFFCNLENKKFVYKRMKCLINNNNEEIIDNKEIQNEVKMFYENLYRSKENNIVPVDLHEILDANTPKLTDSEADSIEGNITTKEALSTLKNMQNDKSPGSDGYSSEFFKFFWKDLGNFLVQSINYAFSIGNLSTTQKEGVITCIPKGNKSKKYLKNWRPISLLNVVYKIASGCIAKRIRIILDKIISPDQTGYMSGRSTADNIRLIYDILQYSKLCKKPGILLLIDFEKAFDSLAWSFLYKSLDFFNFGSDIKKWIKLFITDIKSCVSVNGSISPWFKIERGCRQGDPLSPYLFLICSEILALMIKQNVNIKGYFISEIEIKISQLADDTSLFLDGSKESFEYCVHTILEYAKYSGLSMNFDKTNVVWFGYDVQPKIKYLQELNFKWNPESFTTLGIEFTTDLGDITDINIRKKLPAIKTEIDNWSKRDLTPFGKVTVIKSLILSKVVHILQALPTPSKQIIKEVENILYKFLWSNKPDSIKRAVVKQQLKDGGLNMPDIKRFDASLKITWIRKLLLQNAKWSEITNLICPNINRINFFGPEYLKILINNTNNLFWKHTLLSYGDFAKSFKILDIPNFDAASFLYNDNIKINNRIVKNKVFIDNNLYFIRQLKNNGNYISYAEFGRKFYNPKISFILFNSIITAIKRYEKKLSLDVDNNKDKNIDYQPSLNCILKIKKGCSFIYKILNQTDTLPRGIEKWQETGGLLNQWRHCFEKLANTTQDTTLKWLQFRIIHNCLTTNRSVSKFKPEQSDLCQFCNKSSETIVHLFWNCTHTKDFWISLENHINAKCTHANRFHFTKELILFGLCDKIRTDKICDLIILLAKHHIYKCKVRNILPTFINFKHIIHYRYMVESCINDNSREFKNEWHPYLNMFKS